MALDLDCMKKRKKNSNGRINIPRYNKHIGQIHFHIISDSTFPHNSYMTICKHWIGSSGLVKDTLGSTNYLFSKLIALSANKNTMRIEY